ncbi:thioredoxin [Candidatus Pseudothioglobus singularis PS1]|uniref:Thioredoxin n=2 Tax=Candidatus Pseudothioglobus TaxID=2841677 RepID=A0A0M4L528_9GAMM|nr:thioredoxin [Candidatus Pseudothioglobus singularis PS1]
MCSWCWAFKPTWQKILTNLPQNLIVEYLLGGLAPDNDIPMSLETRKLVMDNWRRVQDTVPTTEFNYDFWRLNTPKRSTYISCRAVISARIQNPKFERAMIEEIQYAYYLKAQNPSEEMVLFDLADNVGLNVQAFKKDLNSPRVNNYLKKEIEFSMTMPINGFPSLVLSKNDTLTQIRINYINANFNINQIIA